MLLGTIVLWVLRTPSFQDGNSRIAARSVSKWVLYNFSPFCFKSLLAAKWFSVKLRGDYWSMFMLIDFGLAVSTTFTLIWRWGATRNVSQTGSRQKPWFQLSPHCWRKTIGPPQCWGPAAALLPHGALRHPRRQRKPLRNDILVLEEAIANKDLFFMPIERSLCSWWSIKCFQLVLLCLLSEKSTSTHSKRSNKTKNYNLKSSWVFE